MHRNRSTPRNTIPQKLGRYTPIAAAVIAILRGVHAQEASEGGLDEVIVTASKRAEDLQSVPIAVQALGTRALEQMNVQNFNDYAQQLPAVTFQSSEPGHATVSMRGISAG